MHNRLAGIMSGTSPLGRYLPIGAAILCWIAAVMFVKFFSTRMDAHTQNFFRYFGASVFLSVLIGIIYPGCFRRLAERWKVFLLLGAMVVGFQVCWVSSLYYVDPAFVSLLGKFSTILITVMAFVFYHEERAVVRSGRFITGALMGLAGVAGVIAGVPGFDVGLTPEQLTGILLVLSSAVIWSLYVNLVKHVLSRENSLQAFTFTCIFATLILFPIMMFRGEPAGLVGGHWGLMALVIISGIIGVGGANTNYYLSIKRIGIARSANLVLAHPFLVAVASYFAFGERLTLLQWLFGAVLLGGCALVISVRD